MLAIQPPFILDYFDFSSANNEKVKNIFSLFFLSWEDALWHILEIHKVPIGSKILIPSFFCWDVVKNMQAHGLLPVIYEVSKQLQPKKDDFIDQLKKHQPKIIIIFHAVGIQNNLFLDKSWIEFLNDQSILIEDCAHKLLEVNQIEFLTKNHYLIDSLRKVVPIQGSRVFSQNKLPRVPFYNRIYTFWYGIKIVFLWLLMQLFLTNVHLTKNKFVANFLNRLAELVMKIGYDIIGDNKFSSSGSEIMRSIFKKIAIKKIKEEKIKQVYLYEKFLNEVFKTYGFFKIPYKENEKGELRGFPLGIELQIANSFINSVRDKSLLIRFELDESPWSKKQKIVYLPMGIHVKREDILDVSNIVGEFNSSSKL